MKRIFITFCLAILTPVLSVAQTTQELATLESGIEADLTENILPYWMNNAVDPDGGFYGFVSWDNKPRPLAPKGAILNARILWTFSRAYRCYGLEEYKEIADRAADYFKSHFIDRKYGGVVWSVNSEGALLDGTKQTYANAFGIYGLAEHFRATGNVASLNSAIDLFRTLEEKTHDKVRKGYIETHERDWSPTSGKGVDGKAGATKTMNTHIHVMEAYSNLYQAWPDEALKDALYELVGIVQNELYDADGRTLVTFCDDDWNPINPERSAGHDIETAWLLTEAAGILGDDALLESARKRAVEMTDAALEAGFQKDGGMLSSRSGVEGEFSYAWWCQNEAVNGCINAWQITGDRKYFDAAAATWGYIKQHFIDRENGGWHMEFDEDGTSIKSAKISEWNCPYHNSRMGFEAKSRLVKPSVHTEVMAWSNITGVRLEGELIDFESSLRVGTPGGEIESSGREKQNKIRYDRQGNSQITTTPMHGAIFNQTVTDVDMSTVNLKWSVEATETLKEGAYFCMSFAPKYYSGATVKTTGRKITITAPERNISLTFNKPVKSFVREEDGNKVLYVTFLPKLKKGAKAEYSAVLKVDGTRHHETAHIDLDPKNPGRIFTGFGGNFRIQNVQKDPEVIDYCLEHLRIAFGRVELPWPQWDKEGKEADHIRRSAGMAKKLKETGMPVIVSCWFPPQWAGNQTTRSDGTSRAYSLKAEEMERIYESLASYLIFLKKDYGVEADYFSFNESDLGINVVHTPEEHRDWIKGFGQYLADKGLKTKMLLGDNSDATTFDFIVPTLDDPEAHKYVGAISFHSWRGCDDETLAKWAAASRRINVPLIVGEGSTDAAAHQYPAIFNETTFALYEINLYTRICAISQPWSILQWQLTSDYSLLWGDGIYGSDGPLRPTQRFWNIKQLSMTPADAFAIPTVCDKDNVNVASFINAAREEGAVHIVNNAASCDAVITGLPASAEDAVVYVTNSHQNAEAELVPVKDGTIKVTMPAESFISIITR